MSGTVLVTSPVIPQGNDITVTAPYSGLIPAGYYDGAEVLTANGGSWLPSSAEFNTKVVSASWDNAPNDIWFIYWLHQDSSYIYLCWGSMIMDWSLNVVNHCVTRYNKTTYAIDRYEFAENSAWWRSIAAGVWIWFNGTQIHLFASNTWSAYAWVYFDTATQTFTAYSTILSAFPWTTVAWTGTRTNAPWSTLFENWYNSNTITFWSYTLQGIFRFRYNNAASASPRKYVSWEGYISNGTYYAISPISWIYPWYQLQRYIVNGISNYFIQENRYQWMHNDWITQIIFQCIRSDSSDDFTRVSVHKLNMTNLSWMWSSIQNINNLSSWWNPFGVQQSHYNNLSRDWGDNFKYIRWLSGADGEVIYNKTTNARSWYTYLRNSNNKVPYSNAVSPNWLYTYSWVQYLMTSFINTNSAGILVDPYLEIH